MPKRTLPPGIHRDVKGGYRDELRGIHLSERQYRESYGKPIRKDVHYNYTLREAAQRFKSNWQDKRSVKEIMKDKEVIEAHKTIVSENKKILRIGRKPDTPENRERLRQLQPSSTAKLGKAIEVLGYRSRAWEYYKVIA